MIEIVLELSQCNWYLIGLNIISVSPKSPHFMNWKLHGGRLQKLKCFNMKISRSSLPMMSFPVLQEAGLQPSRERSHL